MEVKCFEKVAKSGMSLEEAVKNKLVPCLTLQDGNLHLRHNHNYYYQIQGQLGITQRQLCYFVVYTGDYNNIFIEEIVFDDIFFRDMVCKLIDFYENCLAPEIILNRRQRNLKCRDPPSILRAQEELQLRKSSKS
ncbi:hypothetical protein NQ315_014682 [Exocentrus adspersus]|uniref:Uncharacterized protein n=1 Tax=Exocentrus adspersus TaxID=1586481 RepID=A0AAV8VQY7_9CUCU|nr:hypothetical protein NQ315_014682 [Exocentrus adspersus]